MGLGSLLSATDISASGLAAERQRMEVVANNIANAHSTRSVEGGPYRRQLVVFASELDQSAKQLDTSGLAGVRVTGVIDDPSALPQVYDPGHPDADADGHACPDVSVPGENVYACARHDGPIAAVRSA